MSQGRRVSALPSAWLDESFMQPSPWSAAISWGVLSHQARRPAGSLECSLGLNNVLGRAEDVSVSFELGMNNSTVRRLQGGAPPHHRAPAHQEKSLGCGCALCPSLP